MTGSSLFPFTSFPWSVHFNPVSPDSSSQPQAHREELAAQVIVPEAFDAISLYTLSLPEVLCYAAQKCPCTQRFSNDIRRRGHGPEAIHRIHFDVMPDSIWVSTRWTCAGLHNLGDGGGGRPNVDLVELKTLVAGCDGIARSQFFFAVLRRVDVVIHAQIQAFW